MASQSAKVVLTLAVFAAVGVLMISPVSTTVNENTGAQSVVNETHAVDFANVIDLSGYDVDPGSETVYGYNETASAYEVAPAGDYTLTDSSGELELSSSSTLFDEGEDVKVSYDYQASDELTALVAGFIPLGLGLLIFVGIARRVEAMT